MSLILSVPDWPAIRILGPCIVITSMTKIRHMEETMLDEMAKKKAKYVSLFSLSSYETLSSGRSSSMNLVCPLTVAMSMI